MWNPKLSRWANEANEAKEPGAAAGIQSWEMQDQVVDNGTPPVDVSRFGTPAQVSPSVSLAGYYPVPENIVCDPSDGSPLIDDCVHAFGTLYMQSSSGLLPGSRGGTWWAGVSTFHSIAVFQGLTFIVRANVRNCRLLH